MKISIVGLGRMGSAMAQRLIAHGFDVLGWDRQPRAPEAAEARGIRIAANAAEAAAEAEMVISIITEDSGVRSIFDRPDGFLQAGVAGKLFIKMSSGVPAPTAAPHRRFPAY